MDKIKVSILGSTGVVGQKMLRILENHPYIDVVNLSASRSKIGKNIQNQWHGLNPGIYQKGSGI